MVLPAIVIWSSLVIDRLFGDPRTALHPTAYVGRFIGWWGQPLLYPAWLQRGAGLVFTVCTGCLYAFPFFIFEHYAPILVYLIGAPFLLKISFAWRCLEEHVAGVQKALAGDVMSGRAEVSCLVSRNTAALSEEEILSAAYESMSENIVDSIISPLFYFCIFGLAGAAFFRVINTADAMLGYRDDRERIGWFPARLDDVLNFIPARLAGAALLSYFALKGRFSPAFSVLRRDAAKRPGFNGGIPMAVIAGGVGIQFVKPGVYAIGDGERSIMEAGDEIVTAVQVTTLLSALIFSSILLAVYFLT